ncbi:hypothetical protein [Rubellimicrobium aerolatum]|uniref:Uncharacterized protein n=1 Tax=Rubellimicrobium aerolatum TaxID=490979 RepID=A0ABW0S9K1_9RHOB|nr:hypothetical protein [Rubellimicrobium aerolatum]MBP1804983.1 hypothetical protein [Rubellimicrobium aerolatum]
MHAWYLKNELDEHLGRKEVDFRSVYRIKGYASSLPESDRQAISSIIDDLEKCVQRQEPEKALTYLSRLAGYLDFLETRESEAAEDREKAEAESDLLDVTPTFELNADDKARVFTLCGEMRRIILASSLFDDAHKRRLLNRINAIEKQLNQPKGLFDVILGGVSDVGEVAGKFGDDVKPLTDRIREIAGIARGRTEQYSQLPPPDEVKQLPKPDDYED